ncbi:hypothetical protein DFP72DRAFT_1059889 [Ephemerocybe angulata]|uniref:Uncharacterized protein n=1 Tax=Ephemerocybe angulata TaxID=980116 RepID=A0A8H6IE09_9AGAR|nr:hypothetical protein DFP72DRAFT_1059889 [Tulosesus angulatus]
MLDIVLTMIDCPSTTGRLTSPASISGVQFPYFGAGRKLTYMESSILSFGDLMEQNVRIWCWAQTDLNGFTHPQPQIWNCLMDLSAFAST